VSVIASGHSLHSAGKEVLSVPFARTTLMQVCAFCVNGLSVWNGLPLELRLLGRFWTHSIIVLKLFFLTLLESVAPLSSSGLEEALYKFLNE